MARKTDQRRELIIEQAARHGLATVDDLARQFAVTASTIRRDLAQLSESGKLARTYGGALVPGTNLESSLSEREGEAYGAKTAIAEWASAQVRDGESLLLDAGSTVALASRRLPPELSLSVTTTSIPIITRLQSRETIDLTALGGRYRRLSQAFVGPLTEAARDRLSFDRLFLGTDGVSADARICEAELEQTRLKELMAARSRNVYVLAHSAKLGNAPFNSWARFAAPWTLVTDSGADPDFLDEFRSSGNEVVVVPVSDEQDPSGDA
jgi:DeoR/GlpR family transcriptional regulator of sugar metabolism